VNLKRPMNLDLLTLNFPPMAIASILHRISGIILFLLLPLVIFCLHCSLKNPNSFTLISLFFTNSPYRWISLIFGSALIYHLLAGIRHMMMDMGWGESVLAGRRSALFVIGLSVILTILLGIWIC
jgi:succinate dehydrogenase / fumarate reductase cytochrome b subunit